MAKKKKEIKADLNEEVITEILDESIVVVESPIEMSELSEVEQPVIEVVLPENKEEYPNQRTISEMLIDYIDSQKADENGNVELNDFFISLYSIPESLVISKDIKYLLDSMTKEGKILLTSSHYHDLGKTFYDAESKAKKHSILDTKILAKK